jgi:hypothetical protein
MEPPGIYEFGPVAQKTKKNEQLYNHFGAVPPRPRFA